MSNHYSPGQRLATQERREETRVELSRLRFEVARLNALVGKLEQANELLLAGHEANIKLMGELVGKE